MQFIPYVVLHFKKSIPNYLLLHGVRLTGLYSDDCYIASHS